VSTAGTLSARRPAPQQLERAEGHALIRLVAGCWWSPRLHHSPNEDMSAIGRQLAAGQGTRPGFPDYILPIACGRYRGCAIELKAPRPHGRSPTPAQAEWLLFFEAQGWRSDVCYGAEHAYALLIDYMKAGPAQP